MADLTRVFDSKHITAKRLKDDNLFEVPLTIVEARVIELKGEPKIEVEFDGIDKTVICNKTNFEIFEGVLGSNSDNWVGAGCTLTLTKERFEGANVDATRVMDVMTP